MPLGTEVGHGPGDILLDGDQLPHGKGRSSPTLFGPMSIVAKRSPISATAELLFIRTVNAMYSLWHEYTLLLQCRGRLSLQFSIK